MILSLPESLIFDMVNAPSPIILGINKEYDELKKKFITKKESIEMIIFDLDNNNIYINDKSDMNNIIDNIPNFNNFRDTLRSHLPFILN